MPYNARVAPINSSIRAARTAQTSYTAVLVSKLRNEHCTFTANWSYLSGLNVIVKLLGVVLVTRNP